MSSPLESTLTPRSTAPHDRTVEVATDVKASVDARKAPRRRRAWLLVGVGAITVGTLLGFGRLRRARQTSAAAAVSVENLIPSVRVHVVMPAAGRPELSLPATTEPAQRTQIHARASGYVKRWLADLGQHVAAGDVLAEIETPDLDQEVRRASATVAEAKASLALAQANADRFRELMKVNAIAREELETREAQLRVRDAELMAAQAEWSRVRDLTQFQAVTAPFAGVITARQVEVGDLVNATSSAGLFTLEQLDPLRAFVDVPQTYVRAVQPGMSAELRLRESPGRVFKAEVLRTAGALNSASRTMRVELRVPNLDGALMAGAFVQVRFALPSSSRALAVPVTAVRIRAAGPQVALVDVQDQIHIQGVTLGRDLGTEIEIVAGLSAGQRVVRNPTDLLRPGTKVRVIENAAKP